MVSGNELYVKLPDEDICEGSFDGHRHAYPFSWSKQVQFLPHGFEAHALFSAHWHSKLPTVSMHTQSIGHGKDTHSFMFCSHLKPVKPFAHSQKKEPGLLIHDPRFWHGKSEQKAPSVKRSERTSLWLVTLGGAPAVKSTNLWETILWSAMLVRSCEAEHKSIKILRTWIRPPGRVMKINYKRCFLIF